MTKIMVNSSPIIALSIIGKLSLLNVLFDEVFIPTEVYREIVDSKSQQYGKQEIKQAIEEGRITVHKIQNDALVNKLYGKLHRGELEVIVGAKELDIEFVLIDEKAARRLAEDFLLTSLGTVGLLILAKKTGKILRVKEYLDALISRNFRIDRRLYQQVLEEVKEL